MAKLKASIQRVSRKVVLHQLESGKRRPVHIPGVMYIIPDKQPPKLALLYTLGVCSIFSAWMAWYKERQLRIMERKRQAPLLKAGKESFYRIAAFWDQGNYPFSSLILRVENEPEVGTEVSQANQVSAQLTFTDASGKERFKLQGRWSDTARAVNVRVSRDCV
jgi:hypothetical protein